MEGKIDPGSFNGSATFSGTFLFRRKEISPLGAAEGETKEYVTTYSYDDAVTGTVQITRDGEQAVFSTQLEAVRSGFTKLQYHAIDASDNETWGDNPTITDKSETFNSSGTYRFDIQQ